MSMPEAAVNKYDRMPTGENEIGGARQIGSVQPKAQRELMRDSSDPGLSGRVCAPNGAHQAATLRIDVHGEV